MTPLETFIIDDESDAGKLLNNLLKIFPVIHVKQVFTDGLSALDAVIMEQPPVIFIDIEMPGISGLEFLEQVKKFSPLTKIVFVTAYKDYALEALQKDAFDFICKPIEKAELRRVVHKIVAAPNNEKADEDRPQNDRILVKTVEGYHYVAVNEVLYLEADSNYSLLVLNNGKKIMSSVNLGRIYKQFPENNFVRISRKHIVNKTYLTFINFCKRYCVVSHKSTEHQLEVSVKIKELKKELG
uniref:LytR/AlgR family response regulator transcription factor n=1 Tax=uncultured Draconibacterium sp. TaxID=1573823 RepID=UPI003216D0F1